MVLAWKGVALRNRAKNMHSSFLKWQKGGHHTRNECVWKNRSWMCRAPIMQMGNPFHIEVVSCLFCIENYILQKKITKFYTYMATWENVHWKWNIVCVRGQRSVSRCDEWCVHSSCTSFILADLYQFPSDFSFFSSVVVLFAFLVWRCIFVSHLSIHR